jgi:peptidoglycan hydrolase-like amidase
VVSEFTLRGPGFFLLCGMMGAMRRNSFAVVLAVAVLAGSMLSPAAHAETIVTITGGGWGHGLGMSQYGAYGRALDGRSDTNILEHYYTGAHVRRVAMPHHMRVGLLQTQSSISVSSVAVSPSGGAAAFKVAGRHRRFGKGGPKASWTVEPSVTGGMHLFKNGTKVKVHGNSVFGSPDHPLLFLYHRYGSMAHVVDKDNDYRYGHLEFGTYSSSSCSPGFCLTLVDSLSMQQYVYGLGEVPASWPRAALQSQAIAGRTYAYTRVQASGQHRYPCDCAVYDSTVDQVYAGDSRRTSSGVYWKKWKRAVISTKAQVLLHKSQPIQALYMSSSGGHTENNENVWGGIPVSYLRGVKDRADRVSANPNHTWSVTMSWPDFASKLESSYNLGTLEKFHLVKPFGVSGRVTVVKPGIGGGVRLTGSNGVVRASGWSVRSALGLKDTLFRVHYSYTVANKFASMYRRLHRAPGKTRSRAYAVPKGSKHPKGKAQNFTHGRMTWNRALRRAVWQRGVILRRYDQMGRERSSVGMPSSNVWGGRHYKGAHYAHGDILWSPRSGAHTVRGPFLKTYWNHRGPRGPLSLPMAPRKTSKQLPHHGVWQMFANGSLYQNPMRDKVFALWGHLEARYRKMGRATSRCGYPISSMKPDRKGFVARFQHGKIRVGGVGRVTVRCN